MSPGVLLLAVQTKTKKNKISGNARVFENGEHE